MADSSIGKDARFSFLKDEFDSRIRYKIKISLGTLTNLSEI